MPPTPVQPYRPRKRSLGFIEVDDETWSCFLVTYRRAGDHWKGCLTFRPRDDPASRREVETAEIFVERSEAEIDRKARSLGRPLISALFGSARETLARPDEERRLRTWFRSVLSTNSQDLCACSDPAGPVGEEPDLAHLRSRYASYRIDQVTHLIGLLHPDDFQDVVDTVLEGRTFEFGARDRLQFAMMVVDRLESLLPLPPFEVWIEDYLPNRSTHERYRHALHREGLLP